MLKAWRERAFFLKLEGWGESFTACSDKKALLKSDCVHLSSFIHFEVSLILQRKHCGSQCHIRKAFWSHVVVSNCISDRGINRTSCGRFWSMAALLHQFKSSLFERIILWFLHFWISSSRRHFVRIVSRRYPYLLKGEFYNFFLQGHTVHIVNQIISIT